MLFYFLIFVISFIFSLVSEQFEKKKARKLAYLFASISILIPSVIAGLRAKGIGTDTNYYIDIVFQHSLNSGDFFTAIQKICGDLKIEFIYAVINIFISRFTNNINILYFILEFIILLFVYMACNNNKNLNISRSLSYFLFLLLFYNKSLNMCRQSLAIAIFLYATKYIYSKDFFKYLLLCLISSGFHVSGILMIIAYPIVNYTNKTNKVLRKIIVIFIGLLFLYLYQPILLYLINSLNILDSKYLRYVNSGQNNILFIEFVFIICVLILLLLTKKENTKYNNYLILYCLGVIMYCTGFYSSYAWRIGYYFIYLMIFLIPQTKLYFKFERIRFNIIVPIILLLFVYSSIYYDYFKFDQTVPYQIKESE